MSLHAAPIKTPDAENIQQAADSLKAGQLVAFATETVYGLGADACNEKAVRKIYAAKGRPSNNPLICHIADMDMADRLVEISETAEEIAQAFWPGPMTMVLPLKKDTGIAPSVTAGLDTLAIRIPAHGMARDLLSAFGGPVAAPSANPSGRISPTEAWHVSGLHGDHLAMTLDGGACSVGLESTIIGFDDESLPVILRPGFITADAVSELLALPVRDTAIVQGDGDVLSAPGQMVSHYAPDKPVALNITEPAPTDIHIGFGGDSDLDLSPDQDLEEAARTLFALLRDADSLDGARITVAPVPATGLGIAINDRLRRAAAPR